MKGKKKRVLSLFVAVAMLLSLFSVQSHAEEVATYYVNYDGSRYNRTATVIDALTTNWNSSSNDGFMWSQVQWKSTVKSMFPETSN